MILPSDFDLMCRINYKGLHTYQKVKLRHYNRMLEKFPVGVTVDALAFWPNKIYGWSRINSVQTGEQTATQTILTDKRGLSITAPKYAKDVKFVTLPKGFFEEACSVKEITLGVIASDHVKDFEIRARDRKRKLSLHGLFKSNISSFNGLVLNLNGNVFNSTEYHGNSDNLILDFLTNFDRYPIDVYLTQVLINNGLLVPFIFGEPKLEIEGDSIKVPFFFHWMFQLLYGRQMSVYSEHEHLEWDKIDTSKLSTRLRRTYTKTDGAILELRSTKVQPVIINGFAMRFV